MQTIKKPKDCSKQELDEFISLVIEGGQVNNEGISNRVKNSLLLGFVYSTETKLVAVAAIKTPAEHYKSEVFRKSRTTENSNKYFLELGWIFVSKSYRGQGISQNLCSELIQNVNQPIFATTASDNIPMQSVLAKLGFEKSGQPYLGHNRSLDLFLRR